MVMTILHHPIQLVSHFHYASGLPQSHLPHSLGHLCPQVEDATCMNSDTSLTPMASDICWMYNHAVLVTEAQRTKMKLYKEAMPGRGTQKGGSGHYLRPIATLSASFPSQCAAGP